MALIGLGTAAIGRPLYINIKNRIESEPFDKQKFIQKGEDLLDFAYANGVRVLDTAPGYGLAENLVKGWLNKRAIADVSVSSKWGYTYVANFDPTATLHEQKEHTLSKLNEQWQTTKSLLPSLNIYQIHSATLHTQVLQNIEVLKRLYELKKTHHIQIGLTTTGANQLEVMQAALDVSVENEPLFDSFQVTYNVLDQSLADLLGSDLDKTIIVKEALANGRIFANLARYPHYKTQYSLLLQLSKKYNVGADAIAIRFGMDSIPSNTVLSGASTPHQLAENLKAYDFVLTKDEIVRLKMLKVDPAAYWSERKALEWN